MRGTSARSPSRVLGDVHEGEGRAEFGREKEREKGKVLGEEEGGDDGDRSARLSFIRFGFGFGPGEHARLAKAAVAVPSVLGSAAAEETVTMDQALEVCTGRRTEAR